MNEIVLWSGGIDSTLILYDLLKQGKKVLAVTVDDESHALRAEEKQAREILARKLPKFERKEFTFGKGSGEPDYWFALILMSTKKHWQNSDCNVYMGLHEDPKFQKPALEFYKPVIDIFNRYAKESKKNLELMLPLITYTKDEIMKRIEQTGLLKYCIYSTEELKKRGIYND
jgi:7-cyano-7-deazaguanine synthase in queuosine biosynthesis